MAMLTPPHTTRPQQNAANSSRPSARWRMPAPPAATHHRCSQRGQGRQRQRRRQRAAEPGPRGRQRQQQQCRMQGAQALQARAQVHGQQECRPQGEGQCLVHEGRRRRGEQDRQRRHGGRGRRQSDGDGRVDGWLGVAFLDKGRRMLPSPDVVSARRPPAAARCPAVAAGSACCSAAQAGPSSWQRCCECMRHSRASDWRASSGWPFSPAAKAWRSITGAMGQRCATRATCCSSATLMPGPRFGPSKGKEGLELVEHAQFGARGETMRVVPMRADSRRSRRLVLLGLQVVDLPRRRRRPRKPRIPHAALLGAAASRPAPGSGRAQRPAPAPSATGSRRTPVDTPPARAPPGPGPPPAATAHAGRVARATAPAAPKPRPG